MKPEIITFSDLEKLLFRLGFVSCETTGTHKVFQHSASDTILIFPAYQPQEPLRAIHLASARKALVEKDLISLAAFEGALEKINQA
ncbi:MAG: hypothetical protein C4288_22110 [Leptolyngbya sp. ERB_1_1]